MANWSDDELSSELPLLRARGESQALEYMAKFPDQARELGKEVAAFATTNEGLILLGVSDGGELVGVSGTRTAADRDSLVRRVEGVCHGMVQPPVTPDVRFAVEEDKVVLAIRVPRGPEPVYYCNNVPYVRHVRQARPATPAEVVELVRQSLAQRSGEDRLEKLLAAERQDRHAAEDKRRREQEIARVVDVYADLLSAAKTSGLYGLADAGIAGLDSDADVREAIRRIQLRVGKDPLGRQRPFLEGVDMATFFRYVREKGIRFDQSSVEQILSRMRNDGLLP